MDTTNQEAPKRRGFMLMLSAPSGAGKTTLSRRLLAQHPGLCFSVSLTTRPKRAGEVDGVDYHFVSLSEFERLRAQGALLEWSEIYGHFYATAANSVQPQLQQGNDMLFEIDFAGYQQLAKACPQDVVSIFILPPSMAELKARLTKRGQDAPEVIERRLAQATHEIQHHDAYDYVIINQNLDEAQAQITHIIEAERHRRHRQPHLSAFMQTLA